MPPKPRFTREQVAEAAYQMIKEGGVSALTARDLGSRLGTSARPVFTLFKNMDEVKQAARELALKDFMAYLNDYREDEPDFKQIGMKIVSYGIHEPELFKLLFLQEHPHVGFAQSLKDVGDLDEICIRIVMRDYGLNREEATLMFQQMSINALGLGITCAMSLCDFSEDEIGKRLVIMFASLLMYIKSSKLKETAAVPQEA